MKGSSEESKKKYKVKKRLKSSIIVEDDSFIDKTPAEVRPLLDASALKLQEDPSDEEAFNTIYLYMHRYLLGLSFNHFIIKGQEGKDLYQEGLIALWQKAIPKFRLGRGMSFCNFAKMCIHRHLITLLNTSLNRKKDQPINRAISLDSDFNKSDSDNGEGGDMFNVIYDEGDSFVDNLCHVEDRGYTEELLRSNLSEFESKVLGQYLEGFSYKEMASNLECKDKSIDNALLRIRKKAENLYGGENFLPIFSEKKRKDRKHARKNSRSSSEKIS
jgi:RNA polymerase sporulation-specific sigma factor